MENIYHNPVLTEEIVHFMNVKDNGVYVDCTIGGGGHSAALLKANSNIKIFGFDQDEEAILYSKQRLQDYSQNIIFFNENFINIKSFLAIKKITKVDGILMDIGVSLHQINSIDRGFSFTKDSPLDMRMNRKNLKNAKQIVNEYEKDVLTKIFFEYGEEPFSKKIAYNIVKYRENKSINTTGELSKIIENSVLKKYSNKSKARIFQAIRIEVNNELNVLESTLKDVTELLDKNARLLVISWHSLEDRIVKRVFRETIGYCRCPKELNQCLCKFQPTMKLISKKAITPSEKEIQINHNARSAKLRIIEKV